MVLIVESGRFDQVVFNEGLGHVGKAEVGRLQPDGIDDDMEFRPAPAENVDSGDIRNAQETHLEVVAGDFP